MARLRCFFLASILIGVSVLAPLCYTTAMLVDESVTVQHHHNIYFGADDSSKGPLRYAEEGAAPSMTARYVQLSNGSRFACETMDIVRLSSALFDASSLNAQVQSSIKAIKDNGGPCVRVMSEQRFTVLCWDKEVRLDIATARMSRVLGRCDPDVPQEYWVSKDAFGPYVATVYGNGEECVYKKTPTVTEVRMYCRFTDFDNPMPFLFLRETSQCNFVLRIMSQNFCYIPPLENIIETESVRCRMLD
ncbi:hypothetical protein ABL78_5911 [Leptomonas seymouri]|uniref:MRH domain-containing protein n=1 Tax=Leptomonas seymouri TaxID=5684 RepID=A0A0N0P4N4_LEPSE|nr:hypothetical protein ABL78_5911 [Leptomonas seymouri]|eukprot:KPI85027.1 hypothetical protein ABL78_5911 [Leptomonas seymouri]